MFDIFVERLDHILILLLIKILKASLFCYLNISLKVKISL